MKGKRRISSTSKIKKIILIKKNWRENGSRALPHGRNPHSKILSTSIFFLLFIPRRIPTKGISRANAKIETVVVIISEIIKGWGIVFS